MNKINLIKPAIMKRLFGMPVKCRHAEISYILSTDDEKSKPTEFLLDTSMNAIKSAQNINLKDITKRIKSPPYYTDLWPGDHYKLLAGFVQVMQPKIVIEIGTAEGLSALSMKKFLPTDGKIITFDIIPYTKHSNTYLKKADFDSKLVQYEDDLSNYKIALKHKKLLQSADFIFVDALKDGVMEYKFLENFKKIGLKENAIIIFDDIRVWNMLAFWRNLDYPKLDLTSFGHWSGTGVIQWVKTGKK